ncbi:PREDICTED: protein OSB2, chloroplastic-like [Nicotiana attenuata]|uniref:Protein osb2, chloroplastic n=1 Tax=Nicotiana attenuata TaxID=49451 RepID=A0A1J6JMN1_NICAT|nr:PREDICTED: protein OSB2, chloroplastic-like [Nicotiana attenuata]OIT08161.1 protein osb2, chloroplastic [Nicotiana attenuata]
MALEQTIALTNTFFSSTPRNPFTRTHIPAKSLSFRLFSPLKKASRQMELAERGSIRCSFDYNRNGNSDVHVYEYERFSGRSQYPRPSEIQWNKELCNSVQLIGNVAAPVQIKHLNSGKVVAWTRLAVRKSQNDTTWVNLTFWDELASIANQHVEKGHQIYVSGRLISDTVEGDDGKQQTYYKVVVQQLNFVEKTSPSVASYNGDSNSMAPSRKQNNYPANTTGSTEELWQAFFANPLEWWDNRKNKRSPNYPDFKHKDTGEALWVEGRYNPAWVKSQLAVLDSKMESFHDQNGSANADFMSMENFQF